MPKWGEIYISAKGPSAVWFAFVPFRWWLRIKRVLLEQWMPSQCQAAGGKSAFSAAAKGSSFSPNPSSPRIYIGMTVYIRIYTYARVSLCALCVCVSQCLFFVSNGFVSFFFICVCLPRFSARPGHDKFIFTMCTLMPICSQTLKTFEGRPCSDSKSRWMNQKFIHPNIDSFNAQREKKFAGSENVECSCY